MDEQIRHYTYLKLFDKMILVMIDLIQLHDVITEAFGRSCVFLSTYDCTGNLAIFTVHIVYFTICVLSWKNNRRSVYLQSGSCITVGVVSVYFFLQIIDFGSSDNLRYGCPQCGKRFKEPRYASQHMVMHQEPHLECTSCGRRFRWLTSLRNHRIACHREGMLAEQASTMTRPVGDALERVQQTHDSDNP